MEASGHKERETSPCVSFIQTTMTSNIQLVSLSAAAFSPQPEEEILQCLKSPDSEPVWDWEPRTGGGAHPWEALALLGYPFSRQRAGPHLEVQRQGQQHGQHAGLLSHHEGSAQRPHQMLHVFLTVVQVHLSEGRHLYLRVTIKNNKVLIERQTHVLPERNHQGRCLEAFRPHMEDFLRTPITDPDQEKTNSTQLAADGGTT